MTRLKATRRMRGGTRQISPATEEYDADDERSPSPSVPRPLAARHPSPGGSDLSDARGNGGQASAPITREEFERNWLHDRQPTSQDYESELTRIAEQQFHNTSPRSNYSFEAPPEPAGGVVGSMEQSQLVPDSENFDGQMGPSVSPRGINRLVGGANSRPITPSAPLNTGSSHQVSSEEARGWEGSGQRVNRYYDPLSSLDPHYTQSSPTRAPSMIPETVYDSEPERSLISQRPSSDEDRKDLTKDHKRGRSEDDGGSGSRSRKKRGLEGRQRSPSIGL